MPPLPLLTQRDALRYAIQAVSDFPGLVPLIRPVISPYPLTETLHIEGFVLLLAGPRGRGPWWEMRSVLDYEDVYQRIYAHYEALQPPDDADEEADEEGADGEPRPRAVEEAPHLAVLAGRKPPAPPPDTESLSSTTN